MQNKYSPNKSYLSYPHDNSQILKEQRNHIGKLFLCQPKFFNLCDNWKRLFFLKACRSIYIKKDLHDFI